MVESIRGSLSGGVGFELWEVCRHELTAAVDTRRMSGYTGKWLARLECDVDVSDDGAAG